MPTRYSQTQLRFNIAAPSFKQLVIAKNCHSFLPAMAPKTEPVEEATSSKAASFDGKLDMNKFKFKPEPKGQPRRSPRLIAPGSAVSASPSAPEPSPDPAPKPSPSLSPPPRPRAISKRKSPESQASSTSSRKRNKSGYAPPSTYAHLDGVPDAVAEDLIALFVGLNPGVQTARSGHAYAHPSNHFWKFLHTSGVTTRRCLPEEDGDMPRLYSIGLTNIVSRPSRNGAELSKEEMDAGVAVLETKARNHRPESMVFVGKSIWESVWRVRHGRAIRKDEFKYGWQEGSENMGVVKDGKEKWAGAKIFVATSTSGLAASLPMVEKQAIWRELGSWVEKRRAERKEVKG